MEAIQRIREIIESKLEHFSDGEYLELMNSLMFLSKKIPSAPEPADEDEDDLFSDGDYSYEWGRSDTEEEVNDMEEGDLELLFGDHEPVEVSYFEEGDLELLFREEEEDNPISSDPILNSFYQTSDPTPIRGPYDRTEVCQSIRVLLHTIESTGSRELRARYSVCLYAKLFQTYSFVEDHPQFEAIVVERLRHLLLPETRHIFERLGKLEIMEQWLQVLRSWG